MKLNLNKISKNITFNLMEIQSVLNEYFSLSLEKNLSDLQEINKRFILDIKYNII
jgi:hypothetical protein